MSTLKAPEVRRVAVIGGARIPFARSDGPYATASNQEMLTAALDGLAARYRLDGPGAVGEFVAGEVLKRSRDFNLTRETVPGSVLDPRTPAYDIQLRVAAPAAGGAAGEVARRVKIGSISLQVSRVDEA